VTGVEHTGRVDEPPGRDVEAELVHLRQALEIVQADLERSLNDAPRLQILVLEEGPESDGYDVVAYVADKYGSYWSNVSPPLYGPSAELALASVAEGVQDFLAEEDWRVWPVCPAHNLGTHVKTSGQMDPPGDQNLASPAWWCSGAGGHRVSTIGHLSQGRPGTGRRRGRNERTI
jgi:hypothetical protein